MIYLITFQIKLAIQLILETISRSEYSTAKQMWTLRENCFSARLTGELQRQPGVYLPADRASYINQLEFCSRTPLGF